MADPTEWGAQPAADGPEAWGAQPQEQKPGLLAKGIGMLGSPEGRAQLWQGTQKLPADILKGTLDWFETPGKAVKEGLSSDEEIGFAVNAAIGDATGHVLAGDRSLVKVVGPISKEFDDTVIAPAATRLDAYARVGDPNGVRLEPPHPDTQPSPIRPIEGSPFAGVPRSIAAKTGIPEVDSVLNSPVTKAVIDNPVVDRHYDVPYMAGGSNPLNDATVYIDRHVPKEQTVSGVTFDPADPWTVHENVEQHAMEILTRNGMGDDEAYRVAHFNFAEPAEQAWYRAHGIDQVAAEKQQMTWLPRIQHENPENPPPNLYRAPYPHENVAGAERQAVTETPPTPEETARGMDIIRNAPELQPKSATTMLAQARDLGVIGGDRPALNELPPQEAGRAAMAARQPPGPKLTGPEPEGMTPWRQRWERTLDKMQTPADARELISAAVDANDEFMAARQGDMSPGQVEQLAGVAGLDSTKIDVKGTSAKIKTDAEIRNTIEAFRGINDKIQAAARELAGKRGLDDEAELTELTRLELQRDLLLNASVASKEFAGLRAEFGRIGNTIQEFMKAQKEVNGMRDFLKDKRGLSPDDVRDRARMIADTPPESLPNVLQKMAPSKPHWFYWTWQQGLISGVITHTKYLAVNTGQTYLERVISPAGAAAIGALRGEKVSLSAPLYAHVALVRAVPDAFTAAGQAFKSGLRVPLASELELSARAVENPELGGALTPYGQTTGPEWGMWKRVFNEDQLAGAAKVLGIPGKSANAIHTFFKVLNERASASSRAYEMAGKDGGDFWDRFNHHLANPTDENLKGAVDDAYSGSFMEKLGEKSEAWAKTIRQNPILKWVFPFQHIPLNIARSTIRYSPAAFLGPEMRAALMGEHGAPAQNLAIAKVAVGTSVIGYFIDKALSGQATGDYPTDPKERREWQMMETQPNTVRIGDAWHSLERFGPPGNLARLGANLGTIIKHYDGQDDSALAKALYQSGMAAVNMIGDEVGYQSLRNFIDVLENPKQAARWASWQVGSLMPYSSMVSQFASIHDPDMRVANTLVDGLRYRIPFLRETLLPKRDPLFGEPVPNPGAGSVFRSTAVNTDPVKAEIDRIGQATGWFPAAPQRAVGHVKLNDAQYDRYEATAGPLVKQMLSAAIQSPGYRQAAPAQQEAVLKGMIAAGRAKARAALIMADPSIMQAGIDARKAQITGP